MIGMADTFAKLDRLDEALQWIHKSADLCEECMDSDATVTVRLYCSWASLSMQQGYSQRAEALVQQALEIADPKDPAALTPCTRLVTILTMQGRNSEAETLSFRILSLAKERHDDLVLCPLLRALAETYKAQGRLQEAEKHLQEAMKLEKTRTELL